MQKVKSSYKNDLSFKPNLGPVYSPCSKTSMETYSHKPQKYLPQISVHRLNHLTTFSSHVLVTISTTYSHVSTSLKTKGDAFSRD